MKIEFVIIHCTDTPPTMDIGVAEVRIWHTRPKPEGRGWDDIGYQELVRRSGMLEMGRPHDGDSFLTGKEIGAHTIGYNARSIGIVWVGGKDGDKPTEEQYKALVARTAYQLVIHRLSPDRVLGHAEADPASGKTCPNLNMGRFRLDVREALAAMGYEGA